jgi:hypothetical protein
MTLKLCEGGIYTLWLFEVPKISVTSILSPYLVSKKKNSHKKEPTISLFEGAKTKSHPLHCSSTRIISIVTVQNQQIPQRKCLFSILHDLYGTTEMCIQHYNSSL